MQIEYLVPIDLHRCGTERMVDSRIRVAADRELQNTTLEVESRE